MHAECGHADRSSRGNSRQPVATPRFAPVLRALRLLHWGFYGSFSQCTLVFLIPAPGMSTLAPFSRC